MALRNAKQTSKDETAPLTRTERRRQHARERLVSAVRKLTAEKGVDALTIRDIAEEADIAMGGFYNHFESKDELLQEAVEEIVYQSGEVIDAINAQSDDALEMIATAFITFDAMIQSDPILGWFVVRVSAHKPEWTDSLYQRFARDVKRGIELGQFSVPDVSLAVDIAGASLLNFYRSRLLGRADDAAVADLVHLMLRLLGADEKAAHATAHRVWKTVADGPKEN